MDAVIQTDAVDESVNPYECILDLADHVFRACGIRHIRAHDLRLYSARLQFRLEAGSIRFAFG